MIEGREFHWKAGGLVLDHQEAARLVRARHWNWIHNTSEGVRRGRHEKTLADLVLEAMVKGWLEDLRRPSIFD